MKRALLTACLVAAALAGCERGADTGATRNPNAPGRPGEGNETRVVVPSRGDTPPGGPSGVTGSAPHPASSGGADAVPGVTGSGSPNPGSSVTQQGLGTTGGLGTSGGVAGPPTGAAQSGAAASAGPAAAPSGSTNRTTGGATGTRY